MESGNRGHAVVCCWGFSVVSEWDLTCGDGWMLHLSNMGFFVGWIAGSLIFGWLAEEFGAQFPCSQHIVLLETAAGQR